MEFKLTITGNSAEELTDLMSRISAVSIGPEATTEVEYIRQRPQAPAEPEAEPEPEPAAEPEPEPAAKPASQEAPAAVQAPTVEFSQIQALSRQLVAANRGAEVQKILKDHGARMLSRLPAESYTEVYQQLSKLMEANDNAPA